MLNPFANNNPEPQKTENLSPTAVQTIRLLGSEVLELKATVEEQNKIITSMVKEIKALKSLKEEVNGDLHMIKIDQKDLGNQIKQIKGKIGDIEEETPSYEDILDKYYPNHKSHKAFEPEKINPSEAQTFRYERKTVTPEAMNQNIEKPQPSKGNLQKASKAETSETKTFTFEKLPNLLKLSEE